MKLQVGKDILEPHVHKMSDDTPAIGNKRQWTGMSKGFNNDISLFIQLSNTNLYLNVNMHLLHPIQTLILA